MGDEEAHTQAVSVQDTQPQTRFEGERKGEDQTKWREEDDQSQGERLRVAALELRR